MGAIQLLGWAKGVINGGTTTASKKLESKSTCHRKSEFKPYLPMAS